MTKQVPLNDEGQESILQEAHRLTHGDRNKTYAHPFDDYSCTAALFSAVLGDKLKAPITAHEMALAMVCVKLSRESRVPRRDNTVDGAGYFWVAQMCVEEAQRRSSAVNAAIDEACELSTSIEKAAERMSRAMGWPNGRPTIFSPSED